MKDRLGRIQALQQKLSEEWKEEIEYLGNERTVYLLQRRNGHRHSNDDALTAWYALKKIPQNYSEPLSLLDLGSGIGSVGLEVLWTLRQQGVKAHLTCIEAQEVSYALLCANIEGNGLQEYVTPLLADLRDLNLNAHFTLITGSPPYFPAHTAVLPQDHQKAHARFELRGDVGDYARAALRHISPRGLFVFCFPYIHQKRGEALVKDAGLTLYARRAVCTTYAKDPLFNLYTSGIYTETTPQIEHTITINNEDGSYTDEMREIQKERGY